jgi:xanthine dehydrogenase large subunit
VGFDDAGTILAYRVQFHSDGGAAADLSTSVMERTMLHAENAYFIPHIDIRGRVCFTNYPPNTAFRGFGGPQGMAAIENVMQEITAHLQHSAERSVLCTDRSVLSTEYSVLSTQCSVASTQRSGSTAASADGNGQPSTTASIDALDVRLGNVYGTIDRNVAPYGQIVARNHLPEILLGLAERCDYRCRVAEIEQFNRTDRLSLRGLALTPVKFGISFTTKFLNQANALVNVYTDGTVQVSTGGTEMGQGLNTKIRQLVADAFGLPPDRVLLMPTSTEKNNNTSPTAASAGTDLNGAAALDACRQILARLADYAARRFAAPELGLTES